MFRDLNIYECRSHSSFRWTLIRDMFLGGDRSFYGCCNPFSIPFLHTSLSFIVLWTGAARCSLLSGKPLVVVMHHWFGWWVELTPIFLATMERWFSKCCRSAPLPPWSKGWVHAPCKTIPEVLCNPLFRDFSTLPVTHRIGMILHVEPWFNT